MNAYLGIFRLDYFQLTICGNMSSNICVVIIIQGWLYLCLYVLNSPNLDGEKLRCWLLCCRSWYRNMKKDFKNCASASMCLTIFPEIVLTWILLVFVSYLFSASTIEECNFKGIGLWSAGFFTCWKGYQDMVLCCFSWEV